MSSKRSTACCLRAASSIACDARNADACERLAEGKGRGEQHPFPVQVVRAEPPWWSQPLPPAAIALFRAFSPGPITVVVPTDPAIAPRARDDRGTTALRIPDHRVALAILRAFGGPLACPSANRTGRPPALRADDIDRDLLEITEMVVTGDPQPQGLASTVVDVTTEPPRVLRAGPVSEEQIRRCLGA